MLNPGFAFRGPPTGFAQHWRTVFVGGVSCESYVSHAVRDLHYRTCTGSLQVDLLEVTQCPAVPPDE
jgi:hypothetical protein